MENSNNEKHYNTKKYFIKKNNDFGDLLKVKEYFEEPNKYFLKDKKMVIGNLNLNEQKQPKNKQEIKYLSLSESCNNNNKESKVIKSNHSIMSKSKSYTQGQILTSERVKSAFIPLNLSRPIASKKINQNNNKNSNLKTYLNYLKIKNKNDSEQIGIHYKRKSLSEILNILQISKIREEKNKANGINNLFPKEMSKELRQNIYDQEKILNNKIKLKNNSDLLSKYLSKKLKRKEGELLFNKIEEYRLKKQLIDYIENSKSIRDKFGDNYWIADLRRPKIQKEIRINYFNNGNKNNIPEKVIEYADKDIEFINDPNSLKKNKYANLLRNLSINNLVLSYNGLKFPDIEKINEIEEIKGKNLVDKEKFDILDGKKNINADKKQFRLYKDPMEKKYKNIKDFIYKQNYEKNLRGFKDKSYRINRNIKNNDISNLNFKNYKKKGLFRTHSQIEENKNNKIRHSYIKEALKILKKENMKKSIKILSSN